MKTAVTAALIVYVLAGVITIGVAFMIKFIYWAVRLRRHKESKP